MHDFLLRQLPLRLQTSTAGGLVTCRREQAGGGQVPKQKLTHTLTY